MPYAAETKVPVERSRVEIEQVLAKAGAASFAYLTAETHAMIGFKLSSRSLRFDLPLPQRKQYRDTRAYEQAMRSKWRALLLTIKAKISAVESGITTFEEEFLAHIVMPDGQTVGQHTLPAVTRAYETGVMPPLLLEH